LEIKEHTSTLTDPLVLGGLAASTVVAAATATAFVHSELKASIDCSTDCEIVDTVESELKEHPDSLGFASTDRTLDLSAPGLNNSMDKPVLTEKQLDASVIGLAQPEPRELLLEQETLSVSQQGTEKIAHIDGKNFPDILFIFFTNYFFRCCE
jgi:hypothetical protein